MNSIWMNNNPSLESYYVAVFKDYGFDRLSCDTFADVISFSSISGNIHHVALFYPIQAHLTLLTYLLATNVLSVYRSLKKLKNEGSTMFMRLAVQKLVENVFQ